MDIVCMLREVLLLHSYVIVVCCSDGLCSPRSPFPRTPCAVGSLGSQGCWVSVRRHGLYVCAWHGALGNGKSWLLGGVAWQHLTANQVTRKEFPPMDGKEELTDRLGEGPGLADATPLGI